MTLNIALLLHDKHSLQIVNSNSYLLKLRYLKQDIVNVVPGNLSTIDQSQTVSCSKKKVWQNYNRRIVNISLNILKSWFVKSATLTINIYKAMKQSAMKLSTNLTNFSTYLYFGVFGCMTMRHQSSNTQPLTTGRSGLGRKVSRNDSNQLLK